jgi:molybdopterin-synthase adenylyltransferase
MSLTDNERVRYARNILVPGLAEAGQLRLSDARVLIVGLGGLGSPVALYLAAAGVGTLGLADSDRVDLSNLQRQILHATPRLGQLKTESAAETIRALNPDVRTETFALRLVETNLRDLVDRFDVVVEAADNFETKFLINDVCLTARKPFATAGILALTGHAIFVVPGQSACLRCLTPAIPVNPPTTAEFGVLGALPGMLGSMQALEVIRWIAGLWKPQADGAGLLHHVDGDRMRLRTVRIPRRRDCICSNLWK